MVGRAKECNFLANFHAELFPRKPINCFNFSLLPTAINYETAISQMIEAER